MESPFVVATTFQEFLQEVFSMLHRRAFLNTSMAGLLLARKSAFAGEPNSRLIVHSRVPRNAEPPLDVLVKSWITPNDLFYVRSHTTVPKVDVDTFRLSVEGMVERPFQLSLLQLQTEFGKRTAAATLTCAGNRRSEHSLVKAVSGVPWGAGAIGNAEWGGARLSDLLKKAGIKEGAKHIWFEGTDQIERGSGVIPFGASIPLRKAFHHTAAMPSAMVAYEMNGVPLPPDHGFPMRTVVPGYIGARSVKWLGKIIVSDRPSPNHYVANAYKLVTEGTDKEWSTALPIGPFTINSVICTPPRGARVKSGRLSVAGYALAPGLSGRSVRDVEVSTDGGQSWTTARLTTPPKPFCWQFWKADVVVSPGTTELTTRTVDSAGNAQPETVAWNLKGYMYNAWYQSPIDPR